MSILDKNLIITMPDGSKWKAPISMVANNHANHYKYKYGGDFGASLRAATAYFEESKAHIELWAKIIPWREVSKSATQMLEPGRYYEDDWKKAGVQIHE